MAESPSYNRFLNPWVLHLQKLALELKCPLCLGFFARPTLLPCNHIFCDDCFPTSAEIGSECPLCKMQFVYRDLRPAPYMENLVTIFKGLDATFCATVSSGAGKVLEQCPVSLNIDYDNKSMKEEVNASQGGDSRQSLLLLTANKRVHVPFNFYNQSEVDKSGQFDKWSVPGDIELSAQKGMGDHSERSPNLPLPGLPSICGGHDDPGASELDMHHVVQSSPGSPPSSGHIKGVDDESSDQSSVPDSEKRLAKRSLDKNYGKMLKVMTEKSASDAVGVRDLKRPKKLDSAHLQETNLRSNGGPQLMVSNSEELQVPCCQLEIKTGGACHGSQPHTIPNSANASICAFCQSSQLSEATGPMLHYADGKLVVFDEATHTDVLHVHTKCVEWAPQVYFAGEIVSNLEEEIARGAKLKCTCCGLKGAALGCYAKSCRRSYHVPCAVQVLDCRWDCENFLVLCPRHSSLKFPNERSKFSKPVSKRRCSSAQKPSQLSNSGVTKLNEAKELVLCGSALSSDDKSLLVEYASMTGVSVTKSWSSKVTHVIAATNAEGACSRTLKYLMAILNGRWILNIDWIKACMEAKCPVDEEPYEVGLDNHGCREGPKSGRIRALGCAPKLFSGLNFYFSGEFVLGYKGDLQNLVIVAGGTVLNSKEGLMVQVQMTSTTLVVYNLEPPPGCGLGEVSLVLQRFNEADNLAAEIGSQVIPHTWILESIAACKLQPFVN